MRLLPTLAALLSLVFTCCAGYQLDGAKPSALKDIHTISVPMFKNATLHPRAEALATSAATEAIVQDGTYQLATPVDADAVLHASVSQIGYSQVRSTRLDSLRPEELRNQVTISWQLRDASNPSKILLRGNSTGNSRFFVDANLMTARNNALPDALERACRDMVSRFSNGF